jgi:aconitate hydratase
MLALTFSNEADYEKIEENDLINFVDLTAFSSDKPLHLELVHENGTKDVIAVNHTYNAQQIEWFKAGGALNLIRKSIVS